MTDRELLTQLMSRTFDHLVALQMAMKKIEKEAESDDDLKKKAHALSMIFSALNDVMHPAYELAPELFPDKDLSEFISDLRKTHKYAIEKKLFPVCICRECNESTSGNTDQAQ